ncbi:hypothetical protein LCGC14_1611050 [marine sediment metagenome]|uniref:Uncharacterized protein n=1 Tax=marine sediment metagenome TaxID=412755 RepID=A0A0F9I886_9ZZZZ
MSPIRLVLLTTEWNKVKIKMSIEIKVRTNPPPCKHTVVTAIEDGKEKQIVFHDSDFESDGFVPDEDSREIYKVIKINLKGKKLSESKADFDGFTLTQSLEKG